MSIKPQKVPTNVIKIDTLYAFRTVIGVLNINAYADSVNSFGRIPNPSNLSACSDEKEPEIMMINGIRQTIATNATTI